MAGRSGGRMANDRSPSRTHAGMPGEPAPGLSSLSVERRSHEDLVQVVLEGQLDVYTTPRFREQVRGCNPASTQLVIDLTAVSLLDSAGLGELISLRNEADRGGA